MTGCPAIVVTVPGNDVGTLLVARLTNRFWPFSTPGIERNTIVCDGREPSWSPNMFGEPWSPIVGPAPAPRPRPPRSGSPVSEATGDCGSVEGVFGDAVGGVPGVGGMPGLKGMPGLGAGRPE